MTVPTSCSSGSDCSDLPMASLLLVVQDTDWPQVNVIIGVRFKGADSSVYAHGTPRPFEERMPSRIDPLGSCDKMVPGIQKTED